MHRVICPRFVVVARSRFSRFPAVQIGKFQGAVPSARLDQKRHYTIKDDPSLESQERDFIQNSENVLRQEEILLKLLSESGSQTENISNLDIVEQTTTEIDANDAKEESQDEIPWYLRDEETSEIQPFADFVLPVMPENSPSSLISITEHLGRDLGFQNILVFDLSTSGNYDFQDAKFMILATGKSDKHVANASVDISTYFKTTFSQVPYVEGLVTNSAQRLKHKRLQKKARKNGGAHTVDDTYGVTSNSWVMIDTKVENIIINLLTEDRREMLNLEMLWCPKEDRSLYAKFEPARTMDDIFSGLRRYHTSARRHISSMNGALSLEEAVETGDYLKAATLSNGDATYTLKSLTNYFKNLPLSEAPVKAKSIDKTFSGYFPLKPTDSQWDLRFEFLKMMHLVAPTTFDINYVIRNIYAKQSMTGKGSSKDLKYFIKLLIDSPVWNSLTADEISSKKLNEVSKFIRNNWNISNKSLKLDEETALLLLKVATQQPEGYISPKIVEDAIISNELPPRKESSELVLYSSGFEDVLNIIKSSPDGVRSSPQIIEFVLTVYGNAYHRHSFFDFWKSLSMIPEYSDGTDKPWEFFITFISILGSERFCLEFLEHGWLEYLASGGQITKEIALPMSQILTIADPTGGSFRDIWDAVENV